MILEGNHVCFIDFLSVKRNDLGVSLKFARERHFCDGDVISAPFRLVNVENGSDGPTISS